MFNWLRNLFGSSRDTAINRLRAELGEAQSKIRKIQASYDAALQNDDTIGLWSRADNLSARLANSADVRKQLRERSRHEVGNGCHARGITRTVANDLVGTGARLQCLLEDEAANDAIENAWAMWDAETCFSEKLHTFVLATGVDGEGVGLLTRNPNLLSSVQLDVQVVECDLLCTPDLAWNQKNAVDGIEFDKFGNPSVYHILENHPSEFYGVPKYKKVPAANVLHWFRPDRPQQARGIPDLTPALLIFGHLREYSSAVLQAARVAACLSALIHTNASPDGTETNSCAPEAFSATDLEPGMLMALPDGYNVTQMEPTQPTGTYDAYTQAKLREAAHCMALPYNIATGDFSKDSYAGGRMALQVYMRDVKVRRKHLGHRILDKVFSAWLSEATRIPKLLPPNIPIVAALLPHDWHMDAFPHVDENKAATATTERLNNFTTTLAEECALEGKDWRKVIMQRAKEIELQRSLGVLILPPGTTPPNENSGAPAAEDTANAA